MLAAFSSMVPLLVYGAVAWFAAMIAFLVLGLVWMLCDWPGSVPLSRFAGWFGYLTDAVFSLVGGFATGAFAAWNAFHELRPGTTDLLTMAEYFTLSVVLGVLGVLMVRHGWHTLTTKLSAKTS
jgi:hypothetical protein